MKHKVFFFAVMMMALAIPQNAKAQTFYCMSPSGHEVRVRLVNNEAHLIKPSSDYWSFWRQQLTGNIVLPDSISYSEVKYPVTVIDTQAFYLCTGLTSVTLPNTVTTIGPGAFLNCHGLTSITIPSSVTQIAFSAFSSCGLSTISVANDNPAYDSRNNCNALIHTASNTLIAGSNNTVVPSTVVDIAAGAFGYCSGLTSITLPSTMDTIGNSTFYNCSSLTSITIPSTVTRIEDFAFYHCSGLTSITIPEAVTYIGLFAFEHNTSLTTVNFNATNCIKMGGIPDVWGIFQPRSPFYGCPIQHINIGNNVTRIPDYAFCSHVIDNTITVPSSVTSIGSMSLRADTIIFQSDTPPVLCRDNVVDSLDTVYGYADYRYPFCDSNMYEGWHNCSQLIVPTCEAMHAYADAGYVVEQLELQETTITLTVEANNSSLGTAEIIRRMNMDVDCDSTAIIQAIANPDCYFYRWSNGRTANPDTLHLTGDSSVTAIFMPLYAPQICMVSVDNYRNLVVWEKEYEAASYNIYRESDWAGNYDLVANVPYSSLSQWVDNTSAPSTRSYRYTISAIGLNGQESGQGYVHKTMHLTINKGIGNTWNLIWTEYEGADFVTYMIYRGTDWNNLQLIGTLPVGGNTTFTDENAPDGYVYYQIVVVKATPCNPSKSETMIRSNIATNDENPPVSIREIEYDNFSIGVRDGRIVVDGAEGLPVCVFDMMGRQVAYTTDSSVSAPAAGVYMVKVGDHSARRVLVIR